MRAIVYTYVGVVIVLLLAAMTVYALAAPAAISGTTSVTACSPMQ
jgi:hypothetical protein